MTITGRYKGFCPGLCPKWVTHNSALGACVIHVPFHSNPAASEAYIQSSSNRTMLLSFAGSFDVCCDGAAIRCKLGDLMVAALDQPDVSIRPVLPRHGSKLNATSMGKCTALAVAAVAKAGGTIARRLSGVLPSKGVRGVRESMVGSEDITSDATLMARSIFCLCPAGDNSVTGRFYSAIAAGCIPVVICSYPFAEAFSRVRAYGKFWLKVHKTEFVRDPGALLGKLRGMSAATVASYQQEMARYRADLLYDVPGSRVGSNMLDSIAHKCVWPLNYTGLAGGSAWCPLNTSAS